MIVVVHLNQDELVEAVRAWLDQKYPDNTDLGGQPPWQITDQGGAQLAGLKATRELKT